MVDIKINKEIKAITKCDPVEDIKYEVKNLRFNKTKSKLFGIIIIDQKSKNFYIDFKKNDEVEYEFKPHNRDYEFDSALDDFYNFHVVELSNTEKDENGNIVVKRTIKIK